MNATMRRLTGQMTRAEAITLIARQDGIGKGAARSLFALIEGKEAFGDERRAIRIVWQRADAAQMSGMTIRKLTPVEEV